MKNYIETKTGNGYNIEVKDKKKTSESALYRLKNHTNEYTRWLKTKNISEIKSSFGFDSSNGKRTKYMDELIDFIFKSYKI